MNDKIEWALVPREPTEAMLRRGADRWIEANEEAVTRKDEEESARCAWAAMFAVAPKPEAQAAGVSQLQAASWAVERVLIRRMNIDKRLDGYTKEASEEMARAALSTPASHDAQQLDDLLSKLPKWIDGIPRDLFIKRLKAAIPTPGSHEWQPAEEVYVREADGAYTLCDLQETTFDEAPLYHARQSEAQQPAVVGDFDEWYASYDGIGGPKNPEQLARDAWERAAALTPAATPGERTCWDDLRDYGCAFARDGKRIDPADVFLGPDRSVHVEQKEGNGNGR